MRKSSDNVHGCPAMHRPNQGKHVKKGGIITVKGEGLIFYFDQPPLAIFVGWPIFGLFKVAAYGCSFLLPYGDLVIEYEIIKYYHNKRV